MQLPNSIKKYLLKQNLDKWHLELNSKQKFNNVIVIPALNENETLPNLLKSIGKNKPKYLKETLIIIVVNNTKERSEETFENNQKLLSFLKYETENNNNLNISFVDASSKRKELPNKTGGVGFARKLGMDLALDYFDYQKDSKKLLISLDADCEVSENYLEEIIKNFNSAKVNSAVTSVEHKLPENKIRREAIISYEIFLCYYVFGLKFAGSSFAYLSIGSSIICDVETYVKVGGMNKRKAGEDFYFLEKLNKISRVQKVEKAIVYPSSRISNRVPFGTGPALKKIVENPDEEFTLYNPNIFLQLKRFLKFFNEMRNINQLELFLDKIKKESKKIWLFLEQQNFKNDWEKIFANSKSKEQIEKQKINWLDGFKTLKLVHYLRDKSFPNINWKDAVTELLRLSGIEIKEKADTLGELEEKEKYLMVLRGI